MANVIVFATTLILTSQGWVEPGHPVSKNDLSEEELMTLHQEGKVVSCEYHSPLANAVHAARRSGKPRAEVEQAIRDAVHGHPETKHGKCDPEGGAEPGSDELEIDEDDLDEGEPKTPTEPAPPLEGSSTASE